MGNSKNFAKDTILYALGNNLNTLLAFFLIPIYIRNLSVTEYGVYGLLMVVVQGMSRFGNLGIESSLMRSYFDYESPKEKGKVLFTSLTLIISFLSVISLILIVSDEIITQAMFEGNFNYKYLFHCSIAIGALRTIRKIPQAILRLKQKALLYTVLEVLNFIIGCAIIIYLVEIKKLGLKGLVEGTLLSMIFNIGTLGIVTLRYFKFGVIKGEVIKQLKFGIPLVPAAASSTVITSSTKFFLQTFHSLELVGIFSLATQITGMLETFIGQAIKLSWKPFILKNYRKESFKNSARTITNITAILSISAAILISVFSESFFAILAKDEYMETIIYLPLLLIPQSFWCLVPLYNSGVFISRKTTFIMNNFIIGSVFLVIISYLLIPRLGIYGAIISTAASYFLMFTRLVFYNSNLGYQFVERKHWLIYLIGTVFIIGTYIINSTDIQIFSLNLSFLLKIFYVIGYLAVIGLLGQIINYKFIDIKRFFKY